MVTLRSGRLLKDLKVRNDVRRKIETEATVKAKSPSAEIEDQNKVKDKDEEEPMYIPPKAYMPSIPFPQKQAKTKLDERFGKFLELFKKLCINIPFKEALT